MKRSITVLAAAVAASTALLAAAPPAYAATSKENGPIAFRRLFTSLLVSIIVLGVIATSCTSSGSTSSAPTGATPATNGASGSVTAVSSPSSEPVVPLVGRWETNRTCQGLVSALAEVNLQPLAPAVVGDYFPDISPTELAKKSNLCKGARPQLHSHFFTQGGRFGSLDQNGNQVDDGAYEIVDENTVRIGKVRFRYRIRGGKITFTPVITGVMRRQALAHPLDSRTRDGRWRSRTWAIHGTALTAKAGADPRSPCSEASRGSRRPAIS